MQYWLNLFSPKTWEEFVESGSNLSGFRESRWKTVQKVKPKDRLICYLTGVSRFIGMLEVLDEAVWSESRIWKDDIFPARLKVKPLATLTIDTAIPVLSMKKELSVFENLKNPNSWSGAFRGSPAKWKKSDGDKIFELLREAQLNPTVRKVDPKKLKYSPRIVKSKVGPVAIPDEERSCSEPNESSINDTSNHDLIQHRLVKMGGGMGLNVWVARNDRNRVVEGKKLCENQNVVDELPINFDEVTNRTISLIDVLWLKDKSIVAAFEIESTTSIYSGLLRMGDLIAMQPNINIPLYIVAPGDRRDKVFNEINRPTFSRLDPPLRELCSFISFESLTEKFEQASSLLSYLKPEFLEEMAETADFGEPQ